MSRFVRFDAPRYLPAQLALVDRNMPMGMLAAIVVTVLFAGMHLRLAGNPQVIAWAGAAGFVCVLGLMLCRARPKAGAPAEAVVRHARLLSLVALALGALWGFFAWAFMKTPEPHTTNLVIGALAGINAGGMVLFCSVLPLSFIFLITSVTPVALVLLGSSVPADQLMGLATLTYMFAMLGFGYQAARSVRQSIDLRFVNADLVERLRDQTQRAVEARQVAEDALLDAESANHAKGVFLAAASHDLRQPLHALGLFIGTLAGTGLSTRQRGLLGQIDASAQAASDMLGTLLDFSKVDAGVVTPRPQTFALQPLLERLVQEFMPQAQVQGLALRVHPSPLVAVADPALVERIVRNLLSNALRYTEHGGVLVGCRLRGGGERVDIEVWDTGVGIPRHQQQAIFQEFHQLGNAERDRRKGLGLGLAIVDGLARAMSVRVTVSSVPGRGSVFRLSLPRSRDAVLPAPTPLVLAEGDLASARVLVVDDDESVRSAMADLLTQWGAWCEVAESGAEAEALMARFMPQIVVADYRLRGASNGREVIEQVRLKARRPIPGVLVTGDTSAERLREAQASGAVLLHKPVPAAQLHAVLADLLRVERLSGALPQVDAGDAGLRN
ncbi:MAG TPA: hybrid sensor histidine kinase/response regulator [Candidatus Aquabacterium excrementipullorum]|nr:hybrid sensor histidine kinase/response regulator [Candidatus Aquabacterium excrementipullorum]